MGPPLASVLGKYNLESLKAFIANPTKVDPAYPPMPNPGLSPAQIAAVAQYELDHYKQAAGGGATTAPGATPPDSTRTESGVKH